MSSLRETCSERLADAQELPWKAFPSLVQHKGSTMRRFSQSGHFLVCFPAVLLSVVSFQTVHADTTVPITGIGTELAGGLSIKTHVDQVTYSGPTEIDFHGIPAMEIRGTVSGTGWGGTGLIPRASNEHYQYNIPFVARWRKQGAMPRMVFFNHGGGVTLMVAVRGEAAQGKDNTHRTAELSGDLLAGVPVLLDRATYISINRRGLRNDGTFCATYSTVVSPLTAAEVSNIQSQLGGYVQPGVAAGEPVPALPTNDAPTCRDIARALEQVIAGLQGISFRTRIGIETSSGSRLFAALDCGRSVTGPMVSLRTGGNNVVPYDNSSPRIFDGFILCGFTYIPNTEHVDDDYPLSAPMMFFQGQADERYQQPVTLANELLEKGVNLRNHVWIYEIKNLPHVTSDIVTETAGGPDSDMLGCFLSAGIRNLRMYLECRTPPPASRMAGRIIDGQLQFDQVGGVTSFVTPIPNDPARDVITGPMIVPQTLGAADTERWRKVTSTLPHVRDAIVPPTVACRVGGYELMFFGAKLVPSSPAELIAKYGSFECYRRCIHRTVCSLQSQRLYDTRVESAAETAERARSLFGTTTVKPIVSSTVYPNQYHNQPPESDSMLRRNVRDWRLRDPYHQIVRFHGIHTRTNHRRSSHGRRN